MTLKEFASKGGKARAAKLTKERLREIATLAGLASAKQRASKSIARANSTSHVKTYKQATEEIS